MNEREFLILNQYLSNVNRSLRLLENTNELINNVINNNSSINNNSTMNNNNNTRRYNTYRYSRPDNYNIHRRYNQENSRLNRYVEPNTDIDNNTTNPQTYVLRFDTLIPSLSNIINNMNDNSSNNDYSYNIYNFTINDENMNEKLNDYDILDIEKFELIENPINDICPITRERFHNEQNVSMICCCKHIFNKSSLNIWIRNNNTCPSCRVNIKRNE